jgi:Zn-dependent protease
MSGIAFKLGRIPVRILPSFFIMTVLLGMQLSSATRIVGWVVVVLASVIVHELGHASVGRAFGLEPAIALHGSGGTTSWSSSRKLSPGQRIAISVAGPMAGFALGGVALILSAIASRQGQTPGFGHLLVAELKYVNFGWGALNLLPILPLDGGDVLAQILRALRGNGGERAARVTSLVLAGVGCLVALGMRLYWPAILAGSFASMNWQALRALSAVEHDAPLRATLEEAYAALELKDAARVLVLARPVALESRTDTVRAEALQLLAFGFLLTDRVADADAAIAAMPKGFHPHSSLMDLRRGATQQGPR